MLPSILESGGLNAPAQARGSPPSRAVLVTLSLCQWRLSYFEWESQITANLVDSREEEVQGTGNRNISPQSRKKRGLQDLFFGQSGREGKENRKVDGQM